MGSVQPNVRFGDGDIRAPLVAWIASQHPMDGSTGILHELEMSRPSGRIDLAVVNGELAGFEIKSDKDTFARLSRQAKAYSAFFDKVTLVTTETHIERAKNIIPRWWGLILFDRHQQFHAVREPGHNKAVDPTSVLYTLSIREIRTVAQHEGVLLKSGMLKRSIIETVSTSIPKQQLLRLTRDVIRTRALT